MIHRIEKVRLAALSFLSKPIKDQFISRGDMHYFQQTLIGSWGFTRQRLSELPYARTRKYDTEITKLDPVRTEDTHVCSSVVDLRVFGWCRCRPKCRGLLVAV
jgi:hypothetical protein